MNKKILATPTKPYYLVNNPQQLYAQAADSIAKWGRFTAIADGSRILVNGKESGESTIDVGSEMDEYDTPLIAVLELHMPTNSVPICMAFSNSGRYLGAVGHDGILTVFDCENSRSQSEQYPVGSPGESIAIFPSSSATESFPQWLVIRPHNVVAVTPDRVVDRALLDCCVGAFYSPETDQLVLITSLHNAIIIESKMDLSIVKSRPLDSDLSPWGSCVFSPDGIHMAVIDENGRFGSIYNLKTNAPPLQFQPPIVTTDQPDTDLLSAVFSADGRHLWVANEQGTIEVYDTNSGEIQARCIVQPDWQKHEEVLSAYAMITSEDNHLIFGCGDRVFETAIVRKEELPQPPSPHR
jgi:WD40 repeat protein